MSAMISGDLLSWLLTYAVHSTVLLGVAWLMTRSRRVTHGAAEIIWKSALLGGLLTASLQLWLDLRPAGSVALMGQTAQPSAPPAPVLHRAVGVSTELAFPVVASEEAVGLNSTTVAAEPRFTASTPAIVLGFWAAIALVLAVGHAARRLILIGRLGDRTPVTDGPLPDMLIQLARAAQVRVPRLTVSSRISSPVALNGHEICIPVSALNELDVEQQRSMLAHELAHVARRDPQWLVVASGVEQVLWFQPLNRVARRQIATTAEFLSDDWAVRRTGSGVALARCLAQVAEWIQASPLGVPVAGMAEERSLLVTRVARLLENSIPTMTKRRVIALGAFAVLLATVILVPTVAGKPAPSVPVPTQAASDTTKDLTRDDVRLASLERAESLVRELSEHRVLTAKDSAVVLALIARLKDEDAEVRAAAAEALAKLEDARAVPGLVDAMKDSDKRVREAAIEALAKFKDRRALPGLQAALSDPSVEIQKQALEALSNFADAGGIQSAPIIALLNGSRDPEIVHTAIHLLAELKDRNAVAGIRAQLNATNTDVRVAAIQALGELHDNESAPAILQRLSDSNPEVRNAALNAMEELHARIPDATMAALFKERDPDIRQRAANLAGERSMVGVVPALTALVEDANADVRMSAVQALANMADDSAREALRKALTSKDAKVRRSAVEALGERRP